MRKDAHEATCVVMMRNNVGRSRRCSLSNRSSNVCLVRRVALHKRPGFFLLLSLKRRELEDGGRTTSRSSRKSGESDVVVQNVKRRVMLPILP